MRRSEEFQEGEFFSIRDEDKWRTLVPRIGDVLLVELSTSSLEVLDESWAPLMVVHSAIDVGGGITCQVKSLGMKDEDLSKQLSSLFNRKVGFIHLCNASPCIEECSVAFHAIELKWFTLEGYGSFMTAAQSRQAQKWLKGVQEGPREEEARDSTKEDTLRKEEKEKRGLAPDKAKHLKEKLRVAKDRMLNRGTGEKDQKRGKPDSLSPGRSSGSSKCPDSSSSSSSEDAVEKDGDRGRARGRSRERGQKALREGTTKNYADLLAIHGKLRQRVDKLL